MAPTVNRQIPIAVSPVDPGKGYVSDDEIVTDMALTKPYLYAHAAHVLSLTIQHHNHIIFSYSRSLQQSSNYQSFFLSHSSASPSFSETFPPLHPFLSPTHTNPPTPP